MIREIARRPPAGIPVLLMLLALGLGCGALVFRRRLLLRERLLGSLGSDIP